MPDAIDESIRDLTRARSDAVDDLRRAKQRLKSLLLRKGYRYKGKANWSEAHQSYLRELVLPLPALKAVLEEYLLAIDQATGRVRRLEELICVQVPQWRIYPAVQALMCLRGFQLTAASVLVAELGDVHRFAHPRHLMAYLGLVPSENPPARPEDSAASPRRATRTPAGYSSRRSSTAPAQGLLPTLAQTAGTTAAVPRVVLENPGPFAQTRLAPALPGRHEGQGQRGPDARTMRLCLGPAPSRASAK